VIELYLRELEIRDGFDFFNIQVPGAGMPGTVEPNLAENLEISSGYLLPDRLARKRIGIFAHRMQIHIVGKKVDNMFRYGIRVLEWNDYSSSFGKHLGRIPVGG
jgi:hypothetical protein